MYYLGINNKNLTSTRSNKSLINKSLQAQIQLLLYFIDITYLPMFSLFITSHCLKQNFFLLLISILPKKKYICP
ncbi:hypothetical protein CCYN49044_40041 [Capnocytophaga cynodegmi]|nr:hypothetical protein CCYN49044_40041 [Capnocytophaga cynodegmi]